MYLSLRLCRTPPTFLPDVRDCPRVIVSELRVETCEIFFVLIFPPNYAASKAATRTASSTRTRARASSPGSQAAHWIPSNRVPTPQRSTQLCPLRHSAGSAMVSLADRTDWRCAHCVLAFPAGSDRRGGSGCVADEEASQLAG